MDININDGNSSLSTDNLQISTRRIINLCQSLPDGKLYTSEYVASKLGYRKSTILSRVDTWALEKYKVIRMLNGKHRTLYGNEKTITFLKERKDEQG